MLILISMLYYEVCHYLEQLKIMSFKHAYTCKHALLCHYLEQLKNMSFKYAYTHKHALL